MDKLTHIIYDEVDKNNWIPLRMGRNGPFISHMMFVDDLILFREALQCFSKFYQTIGQKVNKTKSQILSFKIVLENIRTFIA